VHAIHIGIGGNYDIVVAQVFDGFVNIQRCLKQIELFVFVNNLLG
jgi:hypothetical protein